MKDLQLRFWPDPCLKTKCEDCTHTPAERIEIGEKMIEIMYFHNGYGLSAPQVGLNCRLFVMRIPEMTDVPTRLSIPSERKGLIFVNPVITKLGDRWVKESEGCLSLLSQRTQVERATEIEFEYNDPYQDASHLGLRARYNNLLRDSGRTNLLLKGMDARCVQHEINHLDGIMIFDHINSNLSRKLFLAKYFKKKARL